jgi:hypothetical protein
MRPAKLQEIYALEIIYSRRIMKIQLSCRRLVPMELIKAEAEKGKLLKKHGLKEKRRGAGLPASFGLRTAQDGWLER